MEKMTLHKALSELKILDSRIEKNIDAMTPVGLMVKGKKVNQFYDLDEFNTNANSKHQSIIDLIERKNKIKKALVLKNAQTTVKIGGEKMTIADAITYKDSIILRRKYISYLRNELNNYVAQMNRSNEQVQANSLRLAETALGNDNINISDKDVKNIINPYIEANELILVDPLKIEKKIESLESEIENFELNVDASLSEINALTTIEI
jgi:hypothetical protein